MIGFRVYLMDGCGRHIEDVVEIMAPSADDAMNATEQRRSRHHWELWQGGRLVRKSMATAHMPRGAGASAAVPALAPTKAMAHTIATISETRRWLISHHTEQLLGGEPARCGMVREVC